MGEINIVSSGNSTGVRRAKKLSTRVDLTPMVDLGFLLITFFIFTTTMSRPTTMKLAVPRDTISDSSQVPESKTLNIVIGRNKTAYFYSGKQIQFARQVGTEGNEIRQVITAKKEELYRQSGQNNGLVLLIKPTEDARYESIVNILDEITINGIRQYFLTEPGSEDLALLAVQR